MASAVTAIGSTVTTVTAHATPSSLLPTEVTTMITDFAGDIVPTVLALIAILVPVGLILWSIGFGTKKAIAFLQKKASKAI